MKYIYLSLCLLLLVWNSSCEKKNASLLKDEVIVEITSETIDDEKEDFRVFEYTQYEGVIPDISGVYYSSIDSKYGWIIKKINDTNKYFIRHVKEDSVPLDWHNAIVSFDTYPTLQFYWPHLKEDWTYDGSVIMPIGAEPVLYTMEYKDGTLLEGKATFPFNPERKDFPVRFIKKDADSVDSKNTQTTTMQKEIPKSFEGLYTSDSESGVLIKRLKDGMYGLYTVAFNHMEKTYKRKKSTEMALYDPRSYPLITFYFHNDNNVKRRGDELKVYHLEVFKGSLIGSCDNIFFTSQFSHNTNLLDTEPIKDFEQSVVWDKIIEKGWKEELDFEEEAKAKRKKLYELITDKVEKNSLGLFVKSFDIEDFDHINAYPFSPSEKEVRPPPPDGT